MKKLIVVIKTAGFCLIAYLFMFTWVFASGENPAGNDAGLHTPASGASMILIAVICVLLAALLIFDYILIWGRK